MKKNLFLLLSFFVALPVIFVACKKNDHHTAVNNTNAQPVVIVFKGLQDADKRVKDDEKSLKVNTECAGDAFTDNYQIVRYCSSGTGSSLTINDILFISTTQPASVSITINGVSYTPTFVSKSGSRCHYKISTSIPLTSIGISDYCTSSSLSMVYYACGSLVNSEYLPINEGVSCSATIQPFAYSSSAGSLTFGIPLFTCSCANDYPTYYTFEYKKTTDATWTTTGTYGYATYGAGITVSGLSSGTYDVQCKSVCTYTLSGPWVDNPNGATIVVQ